MKNTHEALVTQEQWDIVQEVRQHKKRVPKHMDAVSYTHLDVYKRQVLLTCTALEYLREHIVETKRIHYIISKGGTAANSVPDEATLNVELRTNDSAELNLSLIHI